MENIPLHAKVECADGECGESETIIVDPVARTVTHIVVTGKDLPGGRLVPLNLVVSTRQNMIRLSCSRAELAALPQFTEIRYVKQQLPSTIMPAFASAGVATPGYTFYLQPYALTEGREYVPVETELVSAGQMSVQRGMQVHAKDGFIGQVGELLIGGDGRITHIVLLEGHLWGKKEITVPLSAIDYTTADNVYLKLDRKSIELLPAVPVRKADRLALYGNETELIGCVYDTVDQADKVLEELQHLHQSKLLKILNAAVLIKGQDGKTVARETGDWGAAKGARRGLVVGGLLSLLGPVGLVAGAVAGAVVGGLGAKLIDRGFPSSFLDNLTSRLQPGTSAILVVVEHDWVQPLSKALTDRKGIVLHTELADKLVAEMLADA